MKVALIQGKIVWHNPQENFQHFSGLIEPLEDVDLIVLPEMWSSGFTMKAHQHYKDLNDALDLMKSWSESKSATIIGSLIVKEVEEYYNRSYTVSEGKIQYQYDKKHLFGFAGEDRYFNNGNTRGYFDKDEWRICPMICYDLRFPAWCRNSMAYDVLVFSANWPDKRIEAWNTLLKARAIENQCYVIGVNCFGADVWDNVYSGYSSIISYDGTVLDNLTDRPGVVQVVIEKKELMKYREALPFLNDQDRFIFDL